MIDGKTKVYGVIGNPIEHTMSPGMHNLYADRTGVNQIYVSYRVEEDALGDAIKGAAALHIGGLNVTVPHKQHVMEFLKDIDIAAKAIGAVNTLVPYEDGYKGYNTDAAGLKRAMDDAGICIRERDCILIGAGGAAKAAAYVLCSNGAKKVYILNRNIEKAVNIAETMNQMFEKNIMIPMKLSDYKNISGEGYLAVQATSIGMHPNVNDIPIEDCEFYKKISDAIDIIYTPAETRFMKAVKEAGGHAVNGLNMLIYQGVIAYELWNPDVKVDDETIEMVRQKLVK